MNGISNLLGGGNILGTVMNIASVAFPPLGIATSVANMITQGVGQAVNQAAQQLTQAAGMPKFLLDQIGGLVKDVIGQLTQPSNQGCDNHAQENFGGDIGKMIQDLVKQITDGASRSPRATQSVPRPSWSKARTVRTAAPRAAARAARAARAVARRPPATGSSRWLAPWVRPPATT